MAGKIKVKGDQLEISSKIQKVVNQEIIDYRGGTTFYLKGFDGIVILFFIGFFFLSYIHREVTELSYGVIASLIFLFFLIIFLYYYLSNVPTFRADRSKEILFWVSCLGKIKKKYFFRDITSISLRFEHQKIVVKSKFGDQISSDVQVFWYVDVVDVNNIATPVYFTKKEKEARNISKVLMKFLNRPLYDSVYNRIVNAEEASMNLWQKMKAKNDFPNFPQDGKITGLTIEKGTNGIALIIEPQYSLFQNSSFLKYLIGTIIATIIIFILFPGVQTGLFSPIYLFLSIVFFMISIFLALNLYFKEKDPAMAFMFTDSHLKIINRKGGATNDVSILYEDLDDIIYDSNPAPHLEITSGESCYSLGRFLDSESIKSLIQALKALLFEMKSRANREETINS